MKENSLSKQEKSLVEFNQVVVRIMMIINLKSQRVNQLDLLLDKEISMEDSVVKILLNSDTIMKINLVQEDVMIHIQRDRLLTPIKLKKKKTKKLRK
tara:strand:+ start:595 stop:885 length:291 start_codon:yes stop_codon:yes gene_type:complete